MKYSDHIEYLQKLHDMLPEGHVARVYCTRAQYDCYCLNVVRESCAGRIQERLNSSAAAYKEYCADCEEQRAQIGKIVQLMDDTVDDVRSLCKRDLFLKLIDKDDKYVLHCTAGSHFASDFVLYVYNPYEDAHEPVLVFDYDDITGLQEYVQADKIGEAYALIDDYTKSKLGFVPDYEVI